MKFFISIILVLLVMNMFAQGQEGGNSNVNANDLGPTAIEINNGDTKNRIEPGSPYERTAGGLGLAPNSATQGTRPDCTKGDRSGHCSPTPQGGTVANGKGTLKKGDAGNAKPELGPKVSPAAEAKK